MRMNETARTPSPHASQPPPEARRRTRRATLAGATATLSAGAAAVTVACATPAAAPGGAGTTRALAPASLDVWLWWQEPLQPVVQVANAFTQLHPQITVNAQVPPGYWDKVQTSVAGGTGPDVYLMNNVNYR